MLKRRSKIRFHFEYIPTVEVRNHLKQLKPNKATVPHDFPPNIIRGCADCLAQPLSYIINFFLLEFFQVSGKSRKSFHFIKAARVISLKTTGRYLYCLSWLKLQGGGGGEVVRKRLFDHLNKQNQLTKQQFGFRQNTSTELAATLFTDDSRKQVDNKNLLGCVFIDFSKAFDTLSHAKLLAKLPSYGINDIELEWFKVICSTDSKLFFTTTIHQFPVLMHVEFLRAQFLAFSGSCCSQTI